MSRALNEIVCIAAKVRDGEMSMDEPLFVLRARDWLSGPVVREWARQAEEAGCPVKKIKEARALADQMDAWNVKRLPGRPMTTVAN